MGNSHVKRLNAPKAWHVNRKTTTFITKPLPGPHKLGQAVSVNTLIKEVLSYANTTREVKKILNSNEIKVDGEQRKNFKFPVGIFDTVSFVNTGEHFRVLLTKKGKLTLLKIGKEEAATKPCKIIGKTMVRGKLQLNLYDGKNITAENTTYKVGDTLMLSLPGQKIKEHLKLGKSSTIFLTGGKHTGETGTVENIAKDKVTYKDQNGNLIETAKKYAFVIGSDKPMIKLE